MAKPPPFSIGAAHISARSADTHLASGRVLLSMKRWQEALFSFNQYLAARPLDAEAWVFCGQALANLGRLDQAGASYARALELKPQLTSALIGLGEVRERSGDFGAALTCFEQALATVPLDMGLESKRGVALFHLRRFGEAADSFALVAKALPQYAVNWHNWGSAAREAGDLATARACVDKALQLAPDMGVAHFNLGNILRDELKIEEAIGSYQRCVALQPDDAEARFVLAVCQLLLGRFEEGWKGYEWRWSRPRGPVRIPPVDAPRWSGSEDLSQKRLLLLAEQGLGDTIQFCRLAPILAAKGARVSLAVPRPLMGLLSTLEGVERIVSEDEPLPEADFHCPLLSLPLAFGTRLETIPARTPPLSVPEPVQARWRQQLGPRREFRIGLAWAGNPDHGNDRQRSMPLATARGLLPPDAEIHCLQYMIPPRDLPELAMFPQMRFYGAEASDFVDTAAIIREMDLILTVDTSILHLAGALGARTWGLLAFEHDWRWLLNRFDSPWYPSLRLFRQPAAGQWAPVIDAVQRAASALMPRIGA
jgi:Flp pilus assembly protein TadD